MKKFDSQSLQRTLAFAAAVAALGASVGASAQQTLPGPAAENGARPFLPNAGASQYKMDRGQRAGAMQGKVRAGATQMKFRAGAHQLKYDNAVTPDSPGSNNMLNPQPLPPKQGIGAPGAAGVQLPAVQK